MRRLLLGILSLVFCTTTLADPIITTEDADQRFLTLRSLAKKENVAKVSELANQLSTYPIDSYVNYYQLKARIEEASEAEILGFIAKYNKSAIADRLRNDWLLVLGKNGQWDLFDREYPLFILKDDFQLKCYDLQSKLIKGQNVVKEAKSLLIEPRKKGEHVELLNSLLITGQMNLDDIWFYARQANEQISPVSVIQSIAEIAGANPNEAKMALNHPKVYLDKGVGLTRESRELYILALGRLAKKNYSESARILENTNGLSDVETKNAWAQIALPASIGMGPLTNIYWNQTKGIPLSQFSLEWRARTALRFLEWENLLTYISEMPMSLQNDPTWIYWKARGLLEKGERAKAKELFSSIANQYHFYGQLAKEELGEEITIPRSPLMPNEEDIRAFESNEGLARAIKFYEMNMRFEGNREWNWQMRSLDENQLLAAAEFARRKGLLDRMINASERTKNKIDFNQRFPMPFREEIQRHADELGLDMAWVYGLIRQESRFVMNAKSVAGASGLMQLMPATAKLVAKKIGLSEYSQGQINSFDTNILLGTNYLKMMMDQTDDSEPLATAGYNAGPKRPILWRSRLTKTIEGAIFAENIPFRETRDYVKRVTSNATYYAGIINNQPQSLKKRLGMVVPY